MIAREQLEMLLLDRSLGGCTPEVEALLDAYLEMDAETQREAQRWRNLVGEARAALKQGPAELPPFPRERLARRERLLRIWRVGAAVSGIAACVAAGVLVTGTLDKDRKTPTVTAVMKAPESWLREQVATDLQVGGVEDFWSVARIEHDARQNRGGGAGRPPGLERFNSGNAFGGVR